MHNNSRADKVIDCEHFDKSTKIGTEVVWYVASSTRVGAIGQRPHGHRGATPMSKYGQRLKSFREVVRTSFLNHNNC